MTPARICASAPGKVILMGEHSAVYGRPALVAALGRRVRVEVTVGGSQIELDLQTLSHRERCSSEHILAYRDAKSRAWRRFDNGVEGSTNFDVVRGQDPAHVVKVAMGEVARHLGLDSLPSMRLVVSSDLPVGSGFGSSAAVAVGVVAACLALLSGRPDVEQIAGLALEVERRQHGHPSGVDHAAVLHGGILRVDRTQPAVRIQVADWARRDLAVFDTGAPAEPTGEVVAAVRRQQESNAAGFSLLLDGMQGRVVEFEGLLGSSEPPAADVCRVIADFQRSLESLQVVPMPVQERVRRLEAVGAAAKISGAGSLSGPAAGCLLVYRPRQVGRKVDEVLAGYRPIEGAIGVEGLSIEEIA